MDGDKNESVSKKQEYERAIQRANDAEKNFLESLKSRYEQEFTERATIGSGAYAQVRKCTHKLDGQDYAVKRIRFVGSKDLIIPEIQALSRLQHPGIVKYFTSLVEFDDIEQKDFRIIKFGELLNDEKVACYFDLCELDQPSSIPMSIYIQMELCNRLGQGLYTAAKVDIYSLGILLLELLSECTFTWDRFDKIKEFVDHGIIPEVVDQRYRELIVLLTSTDPTKRPWAAEIQEIFNKMEGGACCAPQEQ
ncbi:hypothetical protein C5167_016999 [Papaver somniferum]|uniref:Protein kinase domain-containing protein n=1 Tax=Papaver somniferum TaxID=3469 RepID=A0A4Y7ILF8_PAPSO|nr:hypothetical protein C5167_016999 [Papaver somniferum]